MPNVSWVDVEQRKGFTEVKHCVICNKPKPLFKFPMRTSKGKLYVGSYCSACISSRARAKAKLKLYSEFGYKCSCCGETHPYFLTLEHKLGGNPARRKKTRNGWVITRIQPQLINEAERDGWDREKYDLLCMNCNFAKGHFGECPHISGVSAEQVLAGLRKSVELIGTKHRRTRGKAPLLEQKENLP
jgi:hypothetical protein